MGQIIVVFSGSLSRTEQRDIQRAVAAVDRSASVIRGWTTKRRRQPGYVVVRDHVTEPIRAALYRAACDARRTA